MVILFEYVKTTTVLFFTLKGENVSLLNKTRVKLALEIALYDQHTFQRLNKILQLNLH